MGDRRASGSEPAPWQGRKNSAAALSWKNLRRKPNEKIRLVHGKYLCIVTGAGNGLGRAIAGLTFQDQGIFPEAMAGSKVILVDINEEDLKETSGKKMRQFLKHRKIDVELLIVDLSNLNDTKRMLEDIVERYDKDFEHVILINNASALGDISKQLTDFDDVTVIQRFWDLNITSRMYLTAQFCRSFSQSKRTIVHTTRADTSRPTPFLGMSCMSSSALKTFGEIFAKENPSVRVLHYISTTLDTNKTKTISETCGNKELKEKLASYYELNKVQQPLESAKRMTKTLEDDGFKDGIMMLVEEENNNDL